MAEDKINSYIIIDGTRVRGRFSMTARVAESGGNTHVEVSGLVETTAYLGNRYAEIRGGRLIIKDISIISENYGSETDNIVYGFVAKSYKVLEPEEE